MNDPLKPVALTGSDPIRPENRFRVAGWRNTISR
jgi:hypothetical protein